MNERARSRIWVALTVMAVLTLIAVQARAQEPAGSQLPGDVFASSGEPVYGDTFSSSCEKNNANNPYAGMNPLVCYGVMAPTDSTGKCSLGGMKVLKQEGNTCYYCQPINPPTQGFLVPMDDLAAADNQGFLCGVDQADPNCYAICQGNGTFNPPPGTQRVPPSGNPEQPEPQPTPEPLPTPKPQPTPAPQPCKKQTGTATTDDLVTALYKFYRSQQFTKWGAAYMVGSLMWESQGLNPNINEIGGGPGYGLGQWTNKAPYTSYTALQCYAQAHGVPVSDFVMQMHFTVQQRPDITQLFKTAQNAQQAQNAVTQFENFGVEGANRFAWGAAICQNVVCSQAPPSPFYDDPKVGVPAGTGLGKNVSPALGSGAALFNLIQSMQCPWMEPPNLAASMAACLKNGGPK